MCNNLLPTKDNLFRKKIIPDPTCPLCLRTPETIFHCIWGCPTAVAVWQECKRPLQKLSYQGIDGRGLFMFLMEKLDQENLLEAYLVAKLIWIRRNSVVIGGGGL